MPRLTVLSCGKLKERWQKDAVAEYGKRLCRYVELRQIEVSDAPDFLPEETAKRREGDALLAKWPSGAFVIALDLAGKSVDTGAFAKAVSDGLERGGAHLAFVIAGSRGYDDRVLAKADLRLSLSPLTFTHQIARVLLFEQCYRAFKILSGEPYHK
jgi:23S rRNA (pseudouridine1915-N3)-methyltransferase